MNKKNGQKTNNWKSEQVLAKARCEIKHIQNVNDWAQLSGVSRSWLYTTMKSLYDKTPKQIIKEIRKEKVLQLLEKDIEETAMCLALDSGLQSEDSLRMFLRRNWDTNITKLRNDIITNEFEPEYKWLKPN